MILVIDNYDSFVYNIVQYLFELGEQVIVYRNDVITLDDIRTMNPDHIIISPGPKTPKDAGICIDIIKNFAGKIPILGVCLGLQCIGEAFGGEVVLAKELVHGKAREIIHDGKTIFSGVDSPFKAVRYHSLVVSRKNLPDCLEVSAATDDGEIMALRHKMHRVEGMQFHPESILTEFGKKLLTNFLRGAKEGILVKQALNKVVSGKDLTLDESRSAMEMIMSGEMTSAQIAALITALRMKGETVDEITGFAEVMRKKSERVNTDENEVILDTCGTGGDKSGTFNISTAAAFVIAGAGVKVAKHGNRAVSSNSGSADVLSELGVNIEVPKEKVENCIKEIGIGFMFAPLYHKAMKYAVGPRRELGIRTIFNILGPLSNPARAQHQVMGVYDSSLTETLAEVLGRLGAKRVYVVFGEDGLDEITLTGRTKISEWVNGSVKTWTCNPKDYGFSFTKIDNLKARNVKESSDFITAILQGEKGPKRDIVALNAAAGLVVSGQAETFSDGIKAAQDAIDSGSAYIKLKELIAFTNK
ncbi:MAG: bifunctional anthranilate synthase component II/anthranilate phosphoribosyltransferase [Elusimicrobiota bacterium]